jgi:hypothetical protein
LVQCSFMKTYYEQKTPYTPRDLLAYSMASTLMRLYEKKTEGNEPKKDSVVSMLQKYFTRS